MLTYANVGHCPPWIVHGHHCRQLESLAPPLGMFAEVEAIEMSLLLGRDDWLFVASDGVTEATDEQRNFFSWDTDLVTMVRAAGATPEVVCREVLDGVDQSGADSRRDDLKILASRVVRPEF